MSGYTSVSFRADSEQEQEEPHSEREEIATLEAIVSLADQAEAGVKGVREAWASFCFGPPQMLSHIDGGMGDATEDRLHRVLSTLRESVASLQRLAEEIRNRA